MMGNWGRARCSNCTCGRPASTAAWIFSLDIDKKQLIHEGIIDSTTGMNAKNMPIMGNSYWSCQSCNVPQMATNGEIFTLGWSWNGNNMFNEAGNVFVYTRS